MTDDTEAASIRPGLHSEPRPLLRIATQNGCGTCRYWLPLPQGGVCRRYPPVALMLGVQQGALHGQIQPITGTFWPETPATSWCGEWALRPVDVSAVDLAVLEHTEGAA